MRITQPMLTRRYLSGMEQNYESLVRSNAKMSSGRKYTRASESVMDAQKAMKNRKLMADNEIYKTNVETALGRAAAAEEGVRAVNTLLNRAEGLVVQGLNGTLTAEDREKIAAELSAMQDEAFQIMNTKYGDKYLYNAAGNGTGNQPFTVREAESTYVKDGVLYTVTKDTLFYNDLYQVDQLMKDSSDGKIKIGYISDVADDGTPIISPNPDLVLAYDSHNYIDIGYGYKTSEDGQTIEPITAFKNTYSGIESFGYGTASNGMPLNAWSLLGEMADSLNNNTMDKLDLCLEALPESMECMLTAITEMGTRTQTLESTLERLESDSLALAEKYNELEGVDLSSEIIHNKEYEMSWLVTLQLGNKVLPQSIFDFIR